MAEPPVFITPRNTVGIKLGQDGYNLGIGNRGLELFATKALASSGPAINVDYGLLTIDQPDAALPTLGSNQSKFPPVENVIGASFIGASFHRPLGSSTTLLGYGGMTTHGQLIAGARLEHSLNSEKTLSADLQQRGPDTAASMLYTWHSGTPSTALQELKLGLTLQNNDLALSSSYIHEKKIDLQGLGYLRTQLGAAATLGPTGQFSATAQATVMKDIYTYHVGGVVPLTLEGGISHTIRLDEKPKTSVVWQLKMPF